MIALTKTIGNFFKNQVSGFFKNYFPSVLGIASGIKNIYSYFNRPSSRALQQTPSFNKNYGMASISSQGSLDMQNDLIEKEGASKNDARTLAQSLLRAQNETQNNQNEKGSYDGQY